MYTYAERLRWAMDQTEPPTTRHGLARHIGVRYQSIQYLCDPNRNAKGSRHTPAIARVLGVSSEWLATGAGSPRKKASGRTVQRDAIADCILAAHRLLAELERLARALDEH